MAGDKLVKLIQNEITARNLSIRDFARLVGVSHPTITAVLSGGTPSFELCQKIAPVIKQPLVHVLQLAGLLPPPPPSTEETQEILYLLSILPPEEQKGILELLRWKISQRTDTAPDQKQKQKKSRNAPAQTVLKGNIEQ